MTNSEHTFFSLLEAWQNNLWAFLPKAITATCILALFWILAWLGRRLFLRHQPQRLAARITGWTVYALFIISGIFLALDAMGLTPFLTHMLAGAGIVGIIAGLALKDVASNFFSGLLVKFQHPFAPGDWVEVNSQFGKVIELGLLTTSLKTITGQIAFIPNQLVYSNNFTNYSSLKKWRIVVKCGVSYGDDLAHVKAATLDEITKLPCITAPEQADFYYTDIGASTYNFEVRFWVPFEHYRDYLNATSDAIMHLKQRFDAENIDVAYNVLSLDFGVKGGVNLQDTIVHITDNTPSQS